MNERNSSTGFGELGAAGGLGRVWHLLPWLIAIAIFFTAGGFLSLWTNVLIMILFTMSLDLALGYAGIITLGHAAYFGFGAYVAGIFAVHVTKDPLTGLLVATGLTTVLGFLTGILILHTQGVTLLMLTLAIITLLHEVANQADKWTGGDDGLQGIRMDPVMGLFKFDLWGKTAYLYSLFFLFAWFVIFWRVIHSPFGRSLDGIRQNPPRMRAIGTPVWWRLVAAYTLSSAMAGTAGALSAQTTRFVGLPVLEIFLSGIVAVMLVLGGTKRIWGAFIGATVYVLAQDYFAKVSPEFWMFAIGIGLMLVVLFLEDGLMSFWDLFIAKIRRKGGRKGPA
ncbi:MAG: branched-chain amino acid ABC transporter permease [Rhodospirillales bacterium]|nr:branched-chain amino acid ABC transporter permease [Rhodospirillales bacterium]